MTLTLLDSTDATERMRRSLGANPGSDEGLCALLRAEVHARGMAPRSVTLDRVRRLVAPVAAVDAARLSELAGDLQREGDVVLAPGGVLWATPLRVVPLLNGHARLFSSLSSTDLTTALGVAPEARGAARTVPWHGAMADAVASLGGRVVSPDAWAGLDRQPPADDAFLAGLDERLDWEPERPASLERDGPLDWRGWVADGQPPCWRRDVTSARLWWAKTPYGGHRRAWTSDEGSPARVPFVALSSDEADRARFALSRRAGVSQAIARTITDEGVTLQLPAWIPRAEYRWLSLQGDAVRDAAGVIRWSVPPDVATTVATLLAQRLGLVVEDR